MVAAAVLGIGLVSLVRLHVVSVQGIARSSRASTAAEIARQVADDFATQQSLDLRSLPIACDLGAPPLGEFPGCRAREANGAVFAPVKGGSCSLGFPSAPTPDEQGNILSSGVPLNARDPRGERADLVLRVDHGIVSHPDQTNHPADTHGRYLMVWVCYADESGQVHEIASTRLLTTGF